VERTRSGRPGDWTGTIGLARDPAKFTGESITAVVIPAAAASSSTESRDGGGGSGALPVPSPLAIFDQVREEFLRSLSDDSSSKASSQNFSEAVDRIAPLYVEISSNATEEIKALEGTALKGEASYVIPVDEYPSYMIRKGNGTFKIPPLPGSKDWMAYAAAHKIIENFVRRSVPLLSSSPAIDGGDATSAQIRSLLVPSVRLITLDGTLLMEGASRVASFYHSVASWRKGAFGRSSSWKLTKATVLEWNGNPVVGIDFVANVSLPGTNQVSISGTDVYVLSRPRGLIEEIWQTKLHIGGRHDTPSQDGVRFYRSLAAAVESGRSIADDSVWIDLLQRIGESRQSLDSTSREVESEAETLSVLRSDEAAATVYRIMDSFFREVPDIIDPSASFSLPPAHDYIIEDVRFLGYLGEVILRGRANYDRTFGLSVASLKAALRTGRLMSVKKPSIKVELTADRNVRLSLTFFLKLNPIPGFPLPFDVGPNGEAPGVQFRLGIVSDYILDPDSGRVVQHQIRETRINGQLTPADLVSRWIQRQQRRSSPTSSGGTGSSADGADSVLQGLVDTVKWVRSLSNSDD